MGDGGGKGGGGGSQAVDYYGHVACLICAGQVDKLLGIVNNDSMIWEGTGTPAGLGTNGQGASIIAVEGYGTVRFYWGTETQSADPTLNDNEFSESHPAYRGFCYAVLQDWYLGRETQTAPASLRFIVQRKPRLADGTFGTLDDLGQANPVDVAEEACSHFRHGLAVPAARFTAAWATARTNAAGDTARNYVSPMLRQQATAREFCQLLAEAADVAVTADGENLAAVCRPATPASVVTLDAGKLAGDALPEITARTWAELPERVFVAFTDHARRYKRNAVAVTNGLNPSKDARTLTFDFEGIMARSEQPPLWAERWLGRRGVPWLSGRVVVRRAFATGLVPGAGFTLDIDPIPGGSSLLAKARVVTVTRPAGNRPVTVEWEQEAAVDGYVLVEETPDSPPGVLPEPLVSTRLLESPKVLADGSLYAVVPLAEREDTTTLGVQFWFEPDGETGFTLGGTIRQTALRGQVKTNAVSSTSQTTIRVWLDKVPGPDETTLLASSPGDVDAAADKLLLVLVRIVSGGAAPDTSGGEQLVEWCSISSVSLVTTDTGRSVYDLTVLRGRLGSKARTFAADADSEVWIVARGDVAGMFHPLLADGASFDWRLMPFNSFTAYPLDPDPPTPEGGPAARTFTFGVSVFAPSVSWTTPAAEETDVGATTTTYNVEATVTDLSGGLANVTLLLRERGDFGGGGTENLKVLYTASVDLQGAASYTLRDKLTINQSYPAQELILTARDVDGNVTASSRYFTVNAPAGTVAVPNISPTTSTFVNSVTVTMTCSTAGATIEYSTNSNTGPWSTYTTGITVSGDTDFWARGVKAGMTTSPVVMRSYIKTLPGGYPPP